MTLGNINKNYLRLQRNRILLQCLILVSTALTHLYSTANSNVGSGKTLIACLLVRHTVDQELQDRLVGKQARVSFFLVDSVTLVFQQAAVLECNLDASIGKYCGAMGTDMWSKEQWDTILKKDQVHAYNIEDSWPLLTLL